MQSQLLNSNTNINPTFIKLISPQYSRPILRISRFVAAQKTDESDDEIQTTYNVHILLERGATNLT